MYRLDLADPRLICPYRYISVSSSDGPALLGKRFRRTRMSKDCLFRSRSPKARHDRPSGAPRRPSHVARDWHQPKAEQGSRRAICFPRLAGRRFQSTTFHRSPLRVGKPGWQRKVLLLGGDDFATRICAAAASPVPRLAKPLPISVVALSADRFWRRVAKPGF